MRGIAIALLAACGRVDYDPLAEVGALAIAVGKYHSCALTEDHRILCWGENDRGQLGTGEIGAPRASAGEVLGLGSMAYLTAGSQTTFAIDGDGLIWSWGHGGDGALGTADASDRPAAAPSPGLPGIVEIAAGVGSVCARTAAGQLWCWGDGDGGQLGNGTIPDYSAAPILLALTGVTALAAGTDHACAVAGEQVWCWGSNELGQLGVALSESTETCQNIADAPVPCRSAPIMVPGMTGAAALSGGHKHTCARMLDGRVLCWGDNGDSQLGGSTVDTWSASPVEVAGLGAADAIMTGEEHSCALVADGSVWCWGDDSNGQLGDGSQIDDSLAPLRAALPVPAVATAANSHGQHSCALGSDARVYCWGANDTSQCGAPASGPVLTPQPVVLR